MDIRDIRWDLIKDKIGRWTVSEIHAGQVRYGLTSERNNPFVIAEFTVDFEDEMVSEGFKEELTGYTEDIPLTPEERAEAEQMIKDMKENK